MDLQIFSTDCLYLIVLLYDIEAYNYKNNLLVFVSFSRKEILFLNV